MSIIRYGCCLALALTSTAYAAETKLNSEPVVVTAARLAQPASQVLADTTQITTQDISRAGSISLIDILQRQPGLEVNSTGGPGKVSSVFMRGSSSNHTLILLDGNRLNTATSGLAPLEVIPLAQIDHIEIVRGAGSSLYGADAIGGVIHIFTKSNLRRENQLSARIGYGRYNSQDFQAGINLHVGETSYAFNASTTSTDGYSAIKNATGNDKDRDSYRNQAFSGTIRHTWQPGHDLTGRIFYTFGKSKIDGCFNVTSTTCENQTRNIHYSLTSSNQWLDWWRSTTSLSQNNNRYLYQADSNSRTQDRQTQFSWQNDFNLPVGTISLAYERLQQQAALSPTNLNVTSRSNDGWFAQYLVTHDAHTLQVSRRMDSNSQYGVHNTWAAAYGYQITPEWHARASWGSAFKAPTFSDLYYPGFSNPALRPEQSQNRELALQFNNPALYSRLTLFSNHIQDMISLSPQFVPLNIGSARIAGGTLEVKLMLNDTWQLHGHATVQSAEDTITHQRLRLRAQRYGAATLYYQSGAVDASLNYQFSSSRFNDAKNTQKINGYGLVNLQAGYKLNPDWKIEVQANNIFDKDYTLSYYQYPLQPYNTAGASLSVALRWQQAL